MSIQLNEVMVITRAEKVLKRTSEQDNANHTKLDHTFW